MANQVNLRQLFAEVKPQLSNDISKILLEEWGGPKNLMAQEYYNTVIIPDLIHCLEINSHVLHSHIFLDIFVNKLNMQFGFPPAFARGLAIDIINTTIGVLPIAPRLINVNEPWERLFRMLAIGDNINTISERTAFPLEYIELIQQQYINFIRIVKEQGKKTFDVFTNGELKEYDEDLLKFMYQFWQRFQDPYYLERLKAEDISNKLEINFKPEEILSALIIIHDFEGKASVSEIMTLLKTGSAEQSKKLELFTGNWLLSHYSSEDIDHLIKKLIKFDYLRLDHNGNVCLSVKTAQLVGAVLAPKIVTNILDTIELGNNKNLTEAVKLFQGLNLYVVDRVIDRLARTGLPEVTYVLQQLPQKQNKKVYLKILWALGKIGSDAPINFVITAMQHRDAMIRAKACQSLGNIGDSAGLFALMRCLYDSIPGVKEQALVALGKLGYKGALKRMEEIANNLDENIHVRHVAREVIDQIKQKEEMNSNGAS